MRKKRFESVYLSLFLSALILSGCTPYGDPIPTKISENINVSDSVLPSVTASSTMSDPEESPFPSTMPDDFAIDFEFWIDPAQRNKLDTYTGSIQKDLVSKGTSSSAFSCEKNDLKAIYARMVELSIFELSGNIINDSVQVSPNEIFTIRYRMNGKDFLLSGDSTTSMSDQKEAENLLAIMEYLRDFMKGTPEYEAMPVADGGYD